MLRREPAPPFAGEGPFALWHFSEDPELSRFEPHVAPTSDDPRPLVWAIDTRHAPMFWFPRECPRGCIWRTTTTSEGDRERFFGLGSALRIHVIESAWYDTMAESRVFAYRLPSESFEPHEVGGYWISSEPVVAEERVELDQLVGRHARADIELRVTPSLWPFWDEVVASSVGFSGIRLRNSTTRPH
jgi:hypothetical protein